MGTPLDDRQVAQRYRDIPPELVARLQQFRARHPGRSAIVGGTDWRYLVSGSGDEALLVLTGAACVAELSWLTIEHFARRHRVVAPDYPAVDTMAGLVEGIAGLLDREGIGRVHVMGGSYGGLVAQVFVRRHPDRVASLILSHTLVPERETAVRVAKSARWLEWLPTPVLRALARRRLGGLFPTGRHPEVALTKALLAEIVDTRLTRGQIVSLMRRVVDLGLNYLFTPEDLKAWPGRILILLADDDPATPLPARQAMTAMYPRAQVRTFSGAGHLTAIVKQEEYFGAIDEFLRAPAASGEGRGE